MQTNTTNKANKIISVILACSVIGSAAAAPKAQWATTITNNKTSLLSKSIDSPQVNSNREAVSFSYKLDSQEKLNFNSQPFVENSRQYWLDSSGNKLLKGVQLPVTGGDTIIRISPLTNEKSLQLKAGDIRIKNNGMDKNILVFADGQQLKATGAAFSDQSIALKVQAQAGSLNLTVDSNMGDTPFVIHVFEPNSDYVLSLSSTKATYNANQTISITTDLLSENKNINASLQGYINRPDGSVLGELKFTQNKNGSYSANVNAADSQGLSQGLWEAHVFAKSQDKGIEIMRDAQTSFAVNLNTAAFDNNLNMIKGNVQVGINVGLAGRYEVRGVLMGTDPQSKELKPIAMTMAANWLKTGTQSITLPIDKSLITESHLIAPFTIKNVQLNNQTYFAPVQTIKAGINIIDFK